MATILTAHWSRLPAYMEEMFERPIVPEYGHLAGLRVARNLSYKKAARCELRSEVYSLESDGGRCPRMILIGAPPGCWDDKELGYFQFRRRMAGNERLFGLCWFKASLQQE